MSKSIQSKNEYKSIYKQGKRELVEMGGWLIPVT